MPTATTDPPRLLTTVTQLRLQSERWRAAGLSVGLVPTMGALHEGHRSLLRRARTECDRVVVSIFVNPAQFGAGEDYERYPRTLDRDLATIVAEGINAAYVPPAEAVYPPGFATRVSVDGSLTTGHEGVSRPGHFDGVAVVVAKLLIAARADRAYFGQKDAQQCAVVRRLARDLDTGTRIVVCPTVRDADGLALSSRNRYLSADDRRQALAIPAGLAAAAALFARGETSAQALVGVVQAALSRSPALVPDYVSVVDGETFETVEEAGHAAQIVVAARIGRARLIDTLTLGVDQPPAMLGTESDGREAGSTSSFADRSEPCTVP